MAGRAPRGARGGRSRAERFEPAERGARESVTPTQRREPDQGRGPERGRRPGLARRFADQLRERGFDVVATDNADHFEHQVTHVLDRSGRLGAAREVANGVHSDSVAVVLDADLFLDATVVVGHDWQEVLRRN
ncbi:LytR C-terminal domain-containing protein [Candidatus Palauibacter sp.]|uniref:LytR C-terminal domain-containing protein n=1 Tax=Candidatus Palauibacter sp. TaxID=3101350 RepID=UPI003B02A37C